MLLDRVMEGRDIASPSSILFTIPRDILHLIIGCVASHKRDLASLALVNSTCRQLARSCQFNYLHLDYSPTAVQVLAMLQGEAFQRYRSSDRMTVSPSFGACVRQLKLNADDYRPRYHSMQPPGFISAPEQSYGKDPKRARRTAETLSESLTHLYWPTALHVIPTLANLQSLCLTGCPADDGLLDCLMGLSLRNLELRGDFSRIPNMLKTRNSCPLGMTLETLILGTVWEFHFGSHNTGLDASGFYKTLLASCCSNLRRLEFSHRSVHHGRIINKPINIPLSFDMGFPKLKTLHIGSWTLVDARVISCLIREGLTYLNIPYIDKDISQFLSEIGQIFTLETVLLEGFEAADSTPTHFIEANTQIRSLAVSWAVDAFLRRVIQSLHRHDGNLKRLSLSVARDRNP
ncbi:hypothetical protein CIB48_g10837 [Xylaria polymorpha]|nr:hypothetical protein CIB48_g10837 [Xylaria polymorpha]